MEDKIEEPIWVDCPINRDALQGKSIAFRINSEGKLVEGIGTLEVMENSSGKLSIQIEVTQAPSPVEKRQIRFHTPQAAVPFLRVHPDPQVADYQLRTA